MSLCTVLLLLTSWAWSQSSSGTISRDKGIDPALLSRAQAGDVAAEFQVGFAYEQGDGVSQDFTKAAIWYQKAAEQNDARSQYDLGCLYLFNTAPLDYAKGIAWFRKAAEQGFPAAQTDLARFYQNGEYAPQDYALALSWYRRAAERGNGDGQLGLATLYEGGTGVPQSYSEAYFWMSLAAANSDTAGVWSFLARDRADERDRIAAHLTKTVLLQTQERVRKWAEDHPAPTTTTASSGPSFTMQAASNIESIPSGPSIPALKEQAASGDAKAQFALGDLYEDGNGVPQDYAQAAAWYRKAADQGYAVAQLDLGVLYEHGNGVPKDYAEAYFWLDLAAAGEIPGLFAADFRVGMVKTRDEAAKHLTSADLSRAQKRARKWLEDHPAKPQ
jgi:TPR repeat protein